MQDVIVTHLFELLLYRQLDFWTGDSQCILAEKKSTLGVGDEVRRWVERLKCD